MAENEVLFRKLNERVQNDIKEINKLAKSDRDDSSAPEYHGPIHFFCECADENCRERLVLKPSLYEKIHKNRNRFIIIRGHEVKSVEHVIEDNGDFCIVEKYKDPPSSTASLNPTPITN